MALATLLNTRNPLAAPAVQRARLEALPLRRTFDGALASAGHQVLTRGRTRVLQMNLGKRCNQVCHHCHVDAGPDRTEVMPDEVVDATLDVLDLSGVGTLDITGGAPEIHPRFRDIVSRARAMGRHVMDRCNLTITTLPNYASLPEFLAAHSVEIVASLPAYAPAQTDRQRGVGVFESSLAALRRLNALGYGREGTGLVLNLVTNPVGAFLPASQRALERDWKRELARRYDVEFNRLFTITNMPISRYLEWLERSGNLSAYMEKLVQAFNPATVEGLMCRDTISVAWDGRLFDCDFNQMLDLPVDARGPRTIAELRNAPDLLSWPVVTGPHCFGCTAGAGSSCGGATTA
ncbi:MAG: arsenosugar biosynthesis radical SAM protein ArsS [Acidobacteriota bacterium]|nr:arsenosugar biosynthesis radical SAM protein ArsS [Acidobacteriota bacterium]